MKTAIRISVFVFACIFCGMRCAKSVGRVKPIKADTLEYIDWHTVKLNGSVPMVSTAKALYKITGKPDSIVVLNENDACSSFFNHKRRYIFVKGCQFELYSDTTVINSLNLQTSGLKLVTPKITLDSSTIIESLYRFFPRAYEQKHSMLMEHNKTVTVMNIALSREDGDERGWLLMFDKGKLLRIDVYIPCDDVQVLKEKE